MTDAISYPRFVEEYETHGEMRESWEIREDVFLNGVHLVDDCGGDDCVLHKPSGHHMSGWYLSWRDDRGIFERICEHGVGHPDPDQFDYWRRTDQEWQGVHGCDGCCSVGGFEALQADTSEADKAYDALAAKAEVVAAKLELEILAAKAEEGIVQYKLDFLLRRLDRAAEMGFRATLDEWEVTAVAKILGDRLE